jgi:predicted nucleic acid-binding protein
VKVLLDTNIILDVVLEREGFFNDSKKIFTLIDAKKIDASISANTVTDIYYIVKKIKGNKIGIEIISDLLSFMGVTKIDKLTLEDALKISFNDYEDAILNVSAENNNMEYIVTRNKKDFGKSKLKIVSPKEFLKLFD